MYIQYNSIGNFFCHQYRYRPPKISNRYQFNNISTDIRGQYVRVGCFALKNQDSTSKDQIYLFGVLVNVLFQCICRDNNVTVALVIYNSHDCSDEEESSTDTRWRKDIRCSRDTFR